MTVVLKMCNGEEWGEKKRGRTHVPIGVALYVSKLLNVGQLREKTKKIFPRYFSENTLHVGKT